MIIRETTVDDITALSALARRVYTESFSDSLDPDELESYIQRNCSESYFRATFAHDVTLLAEVDDTLIGYAKFGEVNLPVEGLTDVDRGLHRLYVLQAFQGKGIGTRLLESALNHPVLKSAPRIYLDVWSENAGARRLYERYGFRVIGEHYPFPDGDPDLILVRE